MFFFSHLFVIAVFISFIQWDKNEGALITSPPTPQSALLYSLATFSCEGVGDILNWTFEHHLLNETEAQEKNISIITNDISANLSSNLTIPAVPINHKAEIGCIIRSMTGPNNLAAKETFLLVKGVSPVNGIKWHHDTNLLTWSPPVFYSNDSDDATVFYYVIELNGSYITNTTNISINLNDISNCSLFNVSITVYIGHYISQDTTEIFYNYFENTIVEIKYHTVMFDQSINAVKASIVNMIKFSNQLCNTLYIKGDATHIKNEKLMPYPQLIISNETWVEYNMTNLESSSIYKIEIYLINSFNISEDQDNTTISTYNAQNFSIRSDAPNGSVMVACIFIEGSLTTSCHLKFIDNVRNLNESFNITGPEQTPLTLKESGNYTVTVYDLVNGSIIGPAITYSKEIEVIRLSPSSYIIPSSSIPFSTENESSKTIIPTTSQMQPSGNNNETIIIAASVISVVAVVALCIVVALLAVAYHNKHRHKSVNLQKKNDSATVAKGLELL